MSKKNFSMHLRKQSGETVKFSKDKLENYLKNKSKGLENVDINYLSNIIRKGMAAEMTTTDFLDYCAETAASSAFTDYEYNLLGGFIYMDARCRKIPKKISEAMENVSKVLTMSKKFIKFVRENSKALDDAVDRVDIRNIDYFGMKTILNSFSINKNGIVYEYPKYVFLRTACEVQLGNIEEVINTFYLMANKNYTHATLTLHNSGRKRNQLCSCFLIKSSDSIKGMVKSVNDIIKISSFGGGNAIHIHNNGIVGRVLTR